MLNHIADRMVPEAPVEPRRASLCNAVSITSVFTGTDSVIRDVIATADGDTTATIPHGLGAAPAEVTITKTLSQALAAESSWSVTTIDATNVVCTKLATAGSGNAAAQLRVIIKRPHSLGR